MYSSTNLCFSPKTNKVSMYGIISITLYNLHVPCSPMHLNTNIYLYDYIPSKFTIHVGKHIHHSELIIWQGLNPPCSPTTPQRRSKTGPPSDNIRRSTFRWSCVSVFYASPQAASAAEFRGVLASGISFNMGNFSSHATSPDRKIRLW